jgi:hypothetical protein
MSIANASYEFIYCDIGTNGRVLDDGVTGNNKFYEELNLPLPRKPDNSTSDLPHVFVGDEAFALRKYLPKPISVKNSLLMNVGVLITVCHEHGGS